MKRKKKIDHFTDFFNRGGGGSGGMPSGGPSGGMPGGTSSECDRPCTSIICCIVETR